MSQVTELEANSCWCFLSMHPSVIGSKWWEPQGGTDTHFCDRLLSLGAVLEWRGPGEDRDEQKIFRQVRDRDQVSLCSCCAGALTVWKITESGLVLIWAFISLFVLHFVQHTEAAGWVFGYLSLKVTVSTHTMYSRHLACWFWWWEIRTSLFRRCGFFNPGPRRIARRI